MSRPSYAAGDEANPIRHGRQREANDGARVTDGCPVRGSPPPPSLGAYQVGSDAACSGGDSAGKSGSGIRFPSRRKPAPVNDIARAPPHQMALGDVPSSTPPTAGPRATPTKKLSW